LVLRLIAVALATTLLFNPLSARADVAIFSAREGVALGGYDAVALFEQRSVVTGDQAFSLLWKGVVWHFVSAGNQARFESNPRAYVPAFGGYCAYAMSKGYLAAGDPHLWVVRDGELYLLNNPSVQAIWQDEADHIVADARGNWPRVLHD
jgi:YHS domain-containing protein